LSNPFQIRQARTEALPAIQRVLVKTWHASYDDLFGREIVPEMSARGHSLDALSELIESVVQLMVAVGSMGEVIAKTGGEAARRRGYSVAAMLRPARCAGRGLGTALLAAAISHLPGARVMAIEVKQRNVRAQRFYEEHG
jgi:ribosomal protein S18 acetylase RimI-like enzyme